MFSFLKKKPVMDEHTSEWLIDTFLWSMQEFDQQYFLHTTSLVVPDNKHFPGRVDSAHGMAQLMLDKVQEYAGIAHWPTLLQDQSECSVLQLPLLDIDINTRGQTTTITSDSHHAFVVPYAPEQINNPEAMIASFAHLFAHYMGQMVKTPPPGDMETWPQTTEVIAIYLGFGLMFANSAYQFRGSCGSCSSQMVARQASLTEQQACYALAIFSVLKRIPHHHVTKHLKSHLRGFYKQAVKDISRNPKLVGKIEKN